MSRISDKIRAYVNDPSVSDHFGEWGILRADQRRQIRALCDTCDMFEKSTDELARKQSEWISVDERLPEVSGIYLAYSNLGNRLVLDYSAKHKLFNSFDSYSTEQAKAFAIGVTHWMPLPEVPKMKQN